MSTAKQTGERSKLGELIKNRNEQEAPIQEVRPVASKPGEDDLVKISGFWASKLLSKRLKAFAIECDKKDREIIIAALEAYLPK